MCPLLCVYLPRGFRAKSLIQPRTIDVCPLATTSILSQVRPASPAGWDGSPTGSSRARHLIGQGSGAWGAGRLTNSGQFQTTSTDHWLGAPRTHVRALRPCLLTQFHCVTPYKGCPRPLRSSKWSWMDELLTYCLLYAHMHVSSTYKFGIVFDLA